MMLRLLLFHNKKSHIKIIMKSFNNSTHTHTGTSVRKYKSEYRNWCDMCNSITKDAALCCRKWITLRTCPHHLVLFITLYPKHCRLSITLLLNVNRNNITRYHWICLDPFHNTANKQRHNFAWESKHVLDCSTEENAHSKHLLLHLNGRNFFLPDHYDWLKKEEETMTPSRIFCTYILAIISELHVDQPYHVRWKEILRVIRRE